MPARSSTGLAIVAISMESILDVPGIAASRAAIRSGVPCCHGRSLEIRISAAISVRASVVSTSRTLWTTDLSATIAPTPIAMQTKKNISRFQADRVSRHAVRRMNRI